MILNISGRTDIVAFYTPWLIKRIEAGFVDVRNPIFPKSVSRIYFSDVDMIVFCTKNPHPIINYLEKIAKPIIFQVTLTPYKRDIEINVPSKKDIIEDIKKISNIIGIDNVYVRYDPIFLNEKYNIDYHIRAFNKLCEQLVGYIKHIIVSFIDDYKNVRKNMNVLRIKNFTNEDFRIIGTNFSTIAKSYNISVQTCSEYNNLAEYGFVVDSCVSKSLAWNKTGKKYSRWQARNNKYCECVEMVDIGSYNTCKHYCKYCYANYEEKLIENNYNKHDINSSLLIGNLSADDEIKVRKK